MQKIADIGYVPLANNVAAMADLKREFEFLRKLYSDDDGGSISVGMDEARAVELGAFFVGPRSHNCTCNA